MTGDFFLDNKKDNPIKFHRIPFCGIDFGESPKKLFFYHIVSIWSCFLSPQGHANFGWRVILVVRLSGQAVWPVAIVK